ncbi:nucleotidyltransferase family protein [soil metagenome]
MNRLLTRSLSDPQTTLTLDANGWTALLTIAKAERLAGSLALRLEGLAIPTEAKRVLSAALANAETGRMHALWEAEMAFRALGPLDVPVVLLKGTAFVAAGLDAGRGRLIGDLDILVPRPNLDRVEGALLAAGWEWVKPDPYDDDYYRRWMHELPPLIHCDRDRMIDVHHTILPLTARPTPDADALIADSQPLPNGLRVLMPADMVVHAAAHLFADGDLAGGLRNLWDIDRLLREFASTGFWESLDTAAMRHGLRRETMRALRLSADLFGTPIPPTAKRASDRLYIARLTARDGWGCETRPFLRLAFYVRSHWLRMPPLMLARHLWTKWRK